MWIKYVVSQKKIKLLLQILRKGLITAAAVIVEAKSQNDDKVCRPSELPIYSPQEEPAKTTKLQVDETSGTLESGVREVRETLTKYMDEVNAYKRVGVEHFDRSMENLDCMND